jgi:CheY-like chemotaxis protein
LQIRKTLSYPRLIVGITGNALDVDVKTFIRAGADAIITKPMRPKQLETILGYAMDFEFMSSNEYFLTVVKLTEDEYAVQMRRRDEV